MELWINKALCKRQFSGKTFGPLKIRGFKKRNRNTEGHISLEKKIRAEVYKTSEGNPQVNLVPEIYCFPLTKVLGKVSFEYLTVQEATRPK